MTGEALYEIILGFLWRFWWGNGLIWELQKIYEILSKELIPAYSVHYRWLIYDLPVERNQHKSDFWLAQIKMIQLW